MGLVARHAQGRLGAAPSAGEPGRAVGGIQGVDRSGRPMSEVARAMLLGPWSKCLKVNSVRIHL
jgi:hypothetical protein